MQNFLLFFFFFFLFNFQTITYTHDIASIFAVDYRM